MANKRERQATILELIAAHPVASQEELRRLLRGRGWDVTQTTLSRDLRELRVVRMPDERGRVRYEVAADETRAVLDGLLPHLFVSVDGVGELLLVRTLPGGAQPVASALDGEQWPEVIGTVAGDDSILILCRSAGAREKVVRRVRARAAER